MTQAYLIGGGIASLASAAHLIHDGGLRGSDIHVFEAQPVLGGSLDGAGTPQDGYVIRGGRMFNFSYLCTYELLSFIPSLTDAGRTVLDEFREFNERYKTDARARLVRGGQKVDSSRMGFDMKDRLDLCAMVLASEASLGRKRIDECFQPAFFETPFWYMWATMFAFQPWHSAVEFKRYLHRFVHEFPRINTLAGVDRSPYNQYDSVVLPIETWLRRQGVQFHLGTTVTDIEFEPGTQAVTARALALESEGRARRIEVAPGDLVIFTNGSMTAASTLGSHAEPPPLDTRKTADWLLWERIARQRPGFGRPSVFTEHIDQSWWESFTVTCHDPLMLELIEQFTGNEAGTGALVTLQDSNWLMSFVVARQPHFLNQPAGLQVFWGYGLFPDQPGNFVAKKMADCSGAELMTELCSHLGWQAHLPRLLEGTRCVPCKMPYITSQFLVREPGDRPPVLPPGSTNFAFVGQFCELPDDVVFTVEYSVRAAQTAVYGLLGLDKAPPAIYNGAAHPSVLVHAIQTLLT
ncbi:oleate hydratase [Eleftheria terrae]|uniref:oleate hydratase n=1 Tax=Eleftheria terrae TaxID=1597781 RepID=UPI00263B1C11|nr:oleate hydratase [Eleftheria terrae]WKB53096.1 oleate hydratase [Eleftheria terrae]